MKPVEYGVKKELNLRAGEKGRVKSRELFSLRWIKRVCWTATNRRMPYISKLLAHAFQKRDHAYPNLQPSFVGL